MATQGLINKETLHVICEAKKVTCADIAKETKYAEDKISKGSDLSDMLRPTFIQAKNIAKCLHVPFAGLYMKPEDIPLKKLPWIKIYRTFPDGFMGDDSSLNIAIADLLQAKTNTRKCLSPPRPKRNGRKPKNASVSSKPWTKESPSSIRL